MNDRLLMFMALLSLGLSSGARASDLIAREPSSPLSPEWPGSVAICSLMLNERPAYVLEFVRYHRWAGVDVVYLRENAEEGANAEMEEALEPYIEAGIVNFGYHPGPRHEAQSNWDNECFLEHRHEHSWFSFTDLDEFVVVLDNKQAVTERFALRDELRRTFRLAGAVIMQWILFGSGGQKRPPKDGQMKAFDQCTGMLSPQTKCLGNQYFLAEQGAFHDIAVHQCSLAPGNQAMAADGTPMQMLEYSWSDDDTRKYWSYGWRFPEPEREDLHEKLSDGKQIVMFHYVTRSQNEFVERKIMQSSVGMGAFASEFLEVVTNKSLAADQPSRKLNRLYAEFEHKHGFDGTHSVCSQAGRIAEAMDAANEEWGWTAFTPLL